jgi:hypothetical protein
MNLWLLAIACLVSAFMVGYFQVHGRPGFEVLCIALVGYHLARMIRSVQ